MRAYITSRGRTGFSFGIIGTLFLALGYVLYAMAVGVVIVIVGTAKLSAQLYRQFKYRKMPPPRRAQR